MDLIELIGDSRTDSLPAGFLRSVKIKYKQEASHVFPPATPYNKECHATDGQKRVGSAASIQSTPSFMSWKVPSRLIHGTTAQLSKTPYPAAGLDAERAMLSSRLSAVSRRSAGSHKAPVSPGKLDGDREPLPRLYSSGSARNIISPKHQPVQERLPVMTNQLQKPNGPEKKAVSQMLGEDLKNFEKSMNSTVQPYAAEAVDKWLLTATDKERAIALNFFSTLSGTKAEKLGKIPVKDSHNHSEGECDMCDTGRIEETLQALARDGSGVSRSKLQYNPRRRPDLSRQSHYQTPKRLPPHLRQQFQTWHHLPIYTVPRDGAINKSAMFTQPHRDYGRHFSIHPEWGLHKPLVL